MNGFVGLALVGLVLYCLCSGGSSRRPAGHVHGGTRTRVARHEAGHYVAAKAVGGTPTSAEIHDDGGGLVRWSGTSGTDYQQVVNAVAFLHAGRLAAGTGAGCSGDRSQVQRELRYLPTSQRAAARTEGERLAPRIVSSRSGEIARVARKLDERGRL